MANKLIAYDGINTTEFMDARGKPLSGMRAVTIYGDEGWTVSSGTDRERPDTELFYAARVPIVYRAMLLRANAVASIPFDIVNEKGVVVDSTDDWQDKLGFIPAPESLMWLLEAAWTVSGRAYLYKSMNRYGAVKILRPLAPKAIAYDPDKDMFSRTVGNKEVKYQSAIDKDGKATAGESIVPLWMPDPDVEKGPPLKYPGKAALQAMGVLFNMDEAATGFFKRGMLHVTAFSVPPGTQQADKDQFEDKVKNMLSGIKNAWRTIFVNVAEIKPIDLGGDLSSLANVTLTKDKREDIAIALGVPMSKLFAETASSLGGRGVVEADDKRMILDVALPEFKALSRDLNRQVLLPLGYHIKERSEKMSVMQANEQTRSAALLTYVSAFVKDPEIAIALADQFGITLSDEVLAKLNEIVKRKNATPPPIQLNSQNGGQAPLSSDMVQATDPNAQNANHDMEGQKMVAELHRYQRKAIKSVGKSVHFDSDIIPPDVLLSIENKLSGCKTVDEVKSVFANLPDKQPEGLLELAAAINRAVDAVK